MAERTLLQRFDQAGPWPSLFTAVAWSTAPVVAVYVGDAAPFAPGTIVPRKANWSNGDEGQKMKGIDTPVTSLPL